MEAVFLFDQLKRRVSMDVFDNKVQYLILVFFLVVGITAGTFTVSNMKYSAKIELSEYINLLFITIKQNNIDYFSIFINSFLQNSAIFAIISLFSLLMIGIPTIAVVLMIKGFFVGFTVGVLSLNFGTGGLIAIVFSTFLSNIVLLPCICKAGVLGLNNSICIFKNRKIPKTTKDQIILSKPHFAKMFIIYLVSLIGVIIETLLTPALIKLM